MKFNTRKGETEVFDDKITKNVEDQQVVDNSINNEIDVSNDLDNTEEKEVHTTQEEQAEEELSEEATQQVEEQAEDKTDEEEPPPPPPPVDAHVVITTSKNKLKAYVEITPPENDGEEVSAPMIIKALKENNITTGIVKDQIFKIALEKAYNEKRVIAEGKPPVNGIKGNITHLYDLSKKNQPKVNEDGCVDFKDTGLITNILKDNVICEITKPIDPVDGTDVFGDPVKGEKAPELKIPKGNNTYVSEDGLSLCAQTKGNLRYDNGEYVVDEVFVVQGDVDIAIGDIDFVGKVEVKGNILEGYRVKCVGDVVVSGMMEGATIETKGNAEIRGGITGMDSAKIQCKGDLKTRFIENATIIVNGNLDTDYILNSNVSCNGELKAMGRKGVIIGGSCTALQLIEAKSIGNDNGAKTNITVGITSELMKKRQRLMSEMNTCKDDQQKYAKDLQYLTFKKTMGELSPDRKKLFTTIKSKLPLLATKMKMLNAEEEKIQAILDEAEKSKVVCHGDVYPGVVISIASESMTITRPTANPTFMLIEGKVQSL